VTVKNTGKKAGAEVAQLYISDNKASVPRPAKELKGFEKVYLNPGEQKEVTFTIDKTALSYFDADRHEWTAEPGDFEAQIGNSSDAIKTKVKFTLK
jgi:beta-glucosidase